MSKWKAMLTSRKFWASLIGVVVAVSMLEFSDEQQAELVQAILVVVGTVFYVISVAVEDGLTKVAEAQRLTKIQDVLRDYSQRKVA